jgi:hypothetical protein
LLSPINSPDSHLNQLQLTLLWELLLAVPRLSKATVVDFAAVTTPVLVMGAECDRIVSAGIVFSGAALPVTMSYIDDWMARNHVLAADAAN